MKKILRYGVAFAIAAMMIFSFAACGCSDKEQEQQETTVAEDDGILEESVEKVVKVKKEPEAFYGLWTGNSEKAKALYGNIDFTINEDGTWNGNITGMDIDGTWEKSEYGVDLYCDLVTFNLFYTDEGNLCLEEDGMKIVLDRQK